jgi:murein DD-endopeptidase MepM/ murein hydrolase activator NlpD
MLLNATRSAGTSRSRLLRRLPLLLILVPIVAGLFAAPAASPVQGDELGDARNQAKALQQKIAAQKALIAQINSAQADLRSTIASTTQELHGITADLVAMRKKVALLKDRIANVQAAYEGLLAELASLNADLTRIEGEEATKKEELRVRKDQLATRIRESYQSEQTSVLESLLSGASFTSMLEQMSYQLDIAEQDKALAQRIVSDRETLATLHQSVTATRDQTVVLRQATEAQKRELDARMAELKVAQARLRQLEKETKRALAVQKAAYAKLARDRANLRRALAEAAAARRRLQKRINDIIAEQFQHGNIPSQFNGTLSWPMPGTISQDYGCTGVPFEPPLGNCAHWHNGIDIVNQCGTPIRSSAAGTIAYIGWNYADGPDPAWIVVVAHSQNLQTWYAHMSPTFPGGIHAGSFVRAGQIVGHEASTGHSTGCHLHWMVEYNGDFVNPRLFV